MSKFKNINMRQQVYDKYHGHCAYCGTVIDMKDMQIDHIFPKFRGGQDDISNYNPSCRACNRRKGTLDLESFRRELILTPKRMLDSNANFRQMLRFGQIRMSDKPLRFYFETIDE